MTSSIIGGGDQQGYLVGQPAGADTGQSLPQHLRHFSPLDGPAVAGVVLPGGSVPLSMAEANLLNRHYGIRTPALALPPDDDVRGSFLANADPVRNPDFASFLRGERARVFFIQALMQADPHTLGLGQLDIATLADHHQTADLTARLALWAYTIPSVRTVLDVATQRWLADNPKP